MIRWFSLTSVLLVTFVQSITAQQLPIRTYSPADGLTSSFIQHIMRDSRGYLWISTRNGLARFDGYQFTVYGTEHGLSHPTVNYVLESRNHDYWVTTNGGGLCRFFPKGDPETKSHTLFRCYPVGDSVDSNMVNYALEDHLGRLWAGTDGGLFVMETETMKFRSFPLPSPKKLSEYGFAVMAILEDRENTIWIRTSQAGLFRILPSGRVVRNPGWLGDISWSTLCDRDGQIWMASVDHLQALRSDPKTGDIVSVKKIVSANGLKSQNIRSFHQTSEGLIWLATDSGLSCFNGQNFRTYTTADGLTNNSLSAIAEDLDGNLWIGTQGSGIMKLLRKGFISYHQSSLGNFGPVHSIATSSEGEIFAVSGDWFVHRFQGEKLSSIRLQIPRKFTHLWGSNVALLDSRGEWWAASGQGILRFKDINKSKARIYTAKDGLAGTSVLRIYEDSQRDVWISTPTAVSHRLTKWDHRTNKFYRFGEKDGLISDKIPTSFLDDRNGNLWIGLSDAGLLRYRNGTFQRFSTKDGLPRGMVTALYLDHSSRLWIATNYGGLARVDRPSTEKLTFITYTKREGLAADDCRAITEDRWGRIYVGTVHGVDQLNPISNRIHHYTMADGLGSDFVTVAHTDQNGELWFGTYAGLSRLKPEPDLPPTKVPVLITNLSLAGSPYPISELGEASVSGIRLSHNRNDIQVSFGAVNFSLGENLRFQYKLEGSHGDWSTPAAEHSVRFASLSPGTYHFVVRAVDGSGVISRSPASVGFTILKPFWLQWWFLMLSCIVAALLIHSIYRIRTRSLLKMERLRTRIASDLHDDIGSNLSRIAILSEMVRRKTNGDPRVLPLLANMAEASREAIDSMSDIVWAVNPKKDQLRDLESRMRHLAGEMLVERNTNFHCSSSGKHESYALNPELKRNVFLIFKECLHNVVRHSDGSKVNIRMDLQDGFLVLEIQDDGKGFDPSATFEGQGLRNMKKRTTELNGELEISSKPGEGSVVCLRAPLNHTHFLRTKS
jgi:ligand-binding sensor domain-containing protein/two-component sensor histidine kinase